MSRFRIMLVEDNIDHADLAAECLKGGSPEIDVHCLSSAECALRHLNDLTQAGAPMPNLILLDINMPGMNGLELLKRLKSDANLRLIPAVMLSTSSAASDIRAAMTQSANSYTVKSSDFDTWEASLNSIRDYWRDVDETRHVEIA